jgi:hypothetical protein
MSKELDGRETARKGCKDLQRYQGNRLNAAPESVQFASVSSRGFSCIPSIFGNPQNLLGQLFHQRDFKYHVSLLLLVWKCEYDDCICM